LAYYACTTKCFTAQAGEFNAHNLRIKLANRHCGLDPIGANLRAKTIFAQRHREKREPQRRASNTENPKKSVLSVLSVSL
jgi:hypothetical protein